MAEQQSADTFEAGRGRRDVPLSSHPPLPIGAEKFPNDVISQTSGPPLSAPHVKLIDFFYSRQTPRFTLSSLIEQLHLNEIARHLKDIIITITIIMIIYNLHRQLSWYD